MSDPPIRRCVLALTALAVMLLVPSIAWASAPMCDEAGLSVPAPLPVLEARDSGTLAPAADCDWDTNEAFDAGSTPPERDQRTAPNGPDSCAPLAKPWPAPGYRTSPAPAADDHASDAHARGIFRPPRP